MSIELARVPRRPSEHVRARSVALRGRSARAARAGLTLVVACAAWFVAVPPTAFAQPWIVLPVQHGDGRRVADEAATVGAALAAAGLRPLSGAAIAAAFARAHSEPPRYFAAPEISNLERRTRALAMHLALGEVPAARREYESLRATIEVAGERLVRSRADAARLVDGCLVMVRFLRSVGHHDRAREQALTCAATLPTSEPNPDFHPPDVRDLFARAVAQLGTEARATLRVEVMGGASCQVHVHGIAVGRAPVDLPRVAVGTARVQVQCGVGPKGRVHVVRTRQGANVLRIDPTLDAAVRSGRELALAYADARAADRRVDHGARVARAVGASDAVLVTLGADAATLGLDRVRSSDGRVVATVLLPLPITARALARAVASLRRGESCDQGSDPPRPIAAFRPLFGRSGSTSASWPAAAGAGRAAPWPASGWAVVGGLAGLVSLGASWAFYERSERALDRLSEPMLDFGERERRAATYDAARVPTHAFAALGSVGTTVALPFVLPDVEGVPWWSWLLGGLGAGAVGLGIQQWAVDGTCVRAQAGGCTEVGVTQDRGTLLVLHGVPLLAVPAVYGLRSLTGGGRAPVLAIVPDLRRAGIELTASGRF